MSLVELSLRDAKVLVIGGGMSGVASAALAASSGADVLLVDSGEPEYVSKKSDLLAESGVLVSLSCDFVDALDDYDLVLPSPGVSVHNSPVLSEAIARGLECQSEVEFAIRMFPHERLIGITGTNGKTTVTELIVHLLSHSGIPAVKAGNIGTPLSEVLATVDPDTWVVCELSSFQLALTEVFAPKIGVFLNFGEDHMDWHSDTTDYFESKMSMFQAMNTDSDAILSFDDPAVRGVSQRIPSRITYFSASGVQLGDGLSCDGMSVSGRIDGVPVSYEADGMSLTGHHNMLNASAAFAAALRTGAEPRDLARALSRFNGLPHRVETVLTINDVTYINDSKATNPHATAAALAGLDRPVVLLVGGRNKGMDFSDLAGLAADCRAILCFGESGEEICSSMKLDQAEVLSGLQEAVYRAAELAQAGDIVLMSPACASFDEFSGYAERGEVFKSIVAKLEGTPARSGS